MTAAETRTEHRLGPVDRIPVGEGRSYAVGTRQVAVFRLRDGSLRAPPPFLDVDTEVRKSEQSRARVEHELGEVRRTSTTNRVARLHDLERIADGGPERRVRRGRLRRGDPVVERTRQARHSAKNSAAAPIHRFARVGGSGRRHGESVPQEALPPWLAFEKQILVKTDVAERLEKLGVTPVGSTPEQLGRIQKEDTAKWANVIKTARIQAD